MVGWCDCISPSLRCMCVCTTKLSLSQHTSNKVQVRKQARLVNEYEHNQGDAIGRGGRARRMERANSMRCEGEGSEEEEAK